MHLHKFLDKKKADFQYEKKSHNKIQSVKMAVIVSKNPIRFQIESMSKKKVMHFDREHTFELCENSCFSIDIVEFYLKNKIPAL